MPRDTPPHTHTHQQLLSGLDSEGKEKRVLPACAAVMRAVFPSLSCQLTSTWGHSAKTTTASTKPW